MGGLGADGSFGKFRLLCETYGLNGAGDMLCIAVGGRIFFKETDRYKCVCI
jgi:hypothetical protein